MMTEWEKALPAPMATQSKGSLANVCIRLDNVGQSLQKSTPTRQDNAFTKDIRRKLRRRLFENGTDA